MIFLQLIDSKYFPYIPFCTKKSSYIYRFIAHGTMEEKIYDRQVTKLATSMRVIDEHQVDRHYKADDLQELFNTENIDPKDKWSQSNPPNDDMLVKILYKNPDKIYKFHEHDSLLKNKTEETLSNEEINKAMKEFEEGKNQPTVTQQSSIENQIFHQTKNTREIFNCWKKHTNKDTPY